MDTANTPNMSAPKELVRRLVEVVWNQGKLELLGEIAASPTSPTTFPPQIYQGIEGLINLISAYRAKFPDYQLTIIEQLAEADRVVTHLVGKNRNARDKDESERSSQQLTLLVDIEDAHIVAAQLCPNVEELVGIQWAATPTLQQEFWRALKLPATRHLALIVGLSVILLGFYYYLTWYSGRLAENWLLADTNQLDILPRIGVPADMSDDGSRVVFVSKNDMSDEQNDHNNTYDVYVHDFSDDTTIRVSLASNDGDGDNWSSQPTISADGRYVYFVSAATNLVENDTNERTDLFIYDLISKTTLIYTATSSINNQQMAFATEVWWAPTTSWQRQRLMEQYDQVRYLGHRHLSILSYFYQHLFASTGLGILAAILATLCLTWITRTGWSTANPYLLTLFIGFTATSLLLLSLSNVYSYAENIEANKKAYLAYVSLQNQILTYIGTAHQVGDGEEPSKPMPVNDFILALDQQIRTLNAFPLEINVNDINTPVDLLSPYSP